MTRITIFLIFITFMGQSFQKEQILYNYDPTIKTVSSFVNDSAITIKCKINTEKNPCEWTPKVTFTFPKDIPRPFMQLRISDIGTSVNIVDHTVLICSLSATLGLDIIMKIIWEQITKFMDLVLKCPLDAGSYTVHSFHHTKVKLMFSLLPKNRPFSFSLIVKVRAGKKIVEILNYTEKFEIVEV